MPLITFEKPKCKCCPLSLHGFGAVKKTDEALTIVPGVTVVSKAQLDALKEDEIFQHRLENGTYRIDEKTPDSIQKVNAKSAVAIVKETMDVRVLRRWMVDETRKDVRHVIDAQIDLVKPPTAKAEK